MYVYIIEGKERIKIGYSQSPESRIRDIQPNVSDDIKLAYKTAELPQHRLIERLAHKLLKSHKTKGEWFKVSVQDGIDAINKAIQIAKDQKEDDYLATKSYRYEKLNISILGDDAIKIRKLRTLYEKRYGKRISLRETVVILLTEFSKKIEADPSILNNF